jgi:hypothetical protein
MSLASSPDCLFRSEDKAFKTLFLPVEDSTNAFDEYMNGDIDDRSDQESNKELSEALTSYLEGNESISTQSGFSPIVAPAKLQVCSPQPWRKGLWCLNQNVAAAPDITIAKTWTTTQQKRTSLKRTHDSAGKDPFTDPRSSPDTPSSGTKRFMTISRTANLNQSPYTRQQPYSREATLSPTPMYAQLQHKSRMALQDSWQKDFQNFHLRLSEAGPLSPPVSGRIQYEHTHASQLNAAIAAQNGASVQHHGHQNMYAVSYKPRLARNSYSAVDPAILSQSQISQAISSQGEEASYASQHLAPHGLPIRTTESLESSDESRYSYEDPRNLEQAQLVHDHAWQSPALSMNPVSVPQQYSQQYYYSIIAQPTPHRPTHQLVQQPPPLHTEGLGIHFPPSAALSPPTNTHAAHLMQVYPPLPPPPTYDFTNEDPFSTPQRSRKQSSPLRSPSPCISPTNTTRTLRQHSPTHQSSPTRNRRKSIGNAGPITHTVPPPIPKTPKTPRTPRTPTGIGVVDFINLTPKDSAKLLSDVAPSGSSKTRARREAEAKEKRKRLSEAAVKAVRRAGGDMTVLKAEGLCLS